MSDTEKSYNKFQWFIFIIFIPTIFAIILFIIVMHFLGVDVIEKGKEIGAKVPFISQYFVEEELPDPEELLEQIAVLEDEKETLQKKIEQQEAQIKKLQETIDILEERNQRQVNAPSEPTTPGLQDIVKSYENMSAKNAANILAAMNENEAAKHLQELKADSRAKILEKMEPEKAARLISLLGAQ